MQTIRTIKIDPSNIGFDVYQHLPSGATFVLPSGAELKQAANGDCKSSLPSGKVQLRIEVGVLASPSEVQAKSLAFENSLVDGNARGWIPDPMWTNLPR